jgi:ketosteroid isomerase-like protein
MLQVRRTRFMSEAENAKVVRKLVDALNTWDLEAWMSCFTDDVVGRGMLSGGSSSGIEARRQSLINMKETFAVLHDDIVGLYPSGDHVVLEVQVYSKLAKEYKGQPPGTEKTKYELFIYKFRDGKICESRSYV